MDIYDVFKEFILQPTMLTVLSYCGVFLLGKFCYYSNTLATSRDPAIVEYCGHCNKAGTLVLYDDKISKLEKLNAQLSRRNTMMQEDNAKLTRADDRRLDIIMFKTSIKQLGQDLADKNIQLSLNKIELDLQIKVADNLKEELRTAQESLCKAREQVEDLLAEIARRNASIKGVLKIE